MDAPKDEGQTPPEKRINVDEINAIIGGATGNVRSRRSTNDWSDTGTNISYEGATAPAGGGSVGTGQASGQDATGASISVAPDPDGTRTNQSPNDLPTTTPEQDDSLDRDFTGTP